VAIESNNPKLKMQQGQDAKQQNPTKGQNVGGNLDADVRTNQWSQGVMLSRQLRKNKSGSSPL